MSEFNVNQGNVEWAVRKLANALSDSDQFTLGEVLLAQAEFLGRTIVGISESPVQAISMVQVVRDHLTNTVAAGLTSKGYTVNGTH